MRWKDRKLLTNLGNAAEALCGPEARRGHVTQLAVAEGERVLREAGIDYVSAEEDRLRRGHHLQVGSFADAPRPGGSMWQSLARRTGTIESDYLNGEIVLVGRIHSVPTPVNQTQTLARRAATVLWPPGHLREVDVLGLLQIPE